MKRILVPLDGSVLAARALGYATALAEATGARLLLLRAKVQTIPGFGLGPASVRRLVEVQSTEGRGSALAARPGVRLS